MFELIPEEIFVDILASHLEAVDEGYIRFYAPEIRDALRRTFDEAYETCFLIVDQEAGKPMSTEIITDRRTADDCARVCGPNASVGILLMEQ